MKVPIEFEANFETDKPIPLCLGRLVLHKGSHRYVGRLAFTPEGDFVMAISEAAIKAGAVVVVKEPDDSTLFGFPPA